MATIMVNTNQFPYTAVYEGCEGKVLEHGRPGPRQMARFQFATLKRVKWIPLKNLEIPKLSFKDLPEEVKSAIRQNYEGKELKEDDDSCDYVFDEMTADELWTRYCEWHGLLGWSVALSIALDAIRKVKGVTK